MIIPDWAEELASADALETAAAGQAWLYLADTVTAFFAGCHAAEAQALARCFSGPSPADTASAAAAIIRRTECDAIHVASCITPAGAVVPVALAMAKPGIDPERLARAMIGGTQVGLRLGAALGGVRAFDAGIWPSLFATPLMAAATASVMLGLDADRIAAALSLATAGVAGRPGRATGSAAGRWLLFGEAVGRGCRAALAASQGFSGDTALLSPGWLAAFGDPQIVRPELLTRIDMQDGLAGLALKPFVAARQTANAVVAFQALLAQGIDPSRIEHIEIAVPTPHATMVAQPAIAGSRLSSIASIGFQIAAAALEPALLFDIDREEQPTHALSAYAARVTVRADATLDAHLPNIWAGRATVIVGGQRFSETCTAIPGDPGYGDPAAVVRQKIARLVAREHRTLCVTSLQDASIDSGMIWTAMLDALPGA